MFCSGSQFLRRTSTTDSYTKENERDGSKIGNHIKSGTKAVGTREEYLTENTLNAGVWILLLLGSPKICWV